MPSLLMPRREVQERLAERIEEGTRLLSMSFASVEELEEARIEFSKWDKYNAHLLGVLFSGNSISQTYRLPRQLSYPTNPTLKQRVDQWRREARWLIGCLESVSERLSLMPEGASSAGSLADGVTSAPEALRLSDMHPVVREASEKLFLDGHYRQAILDAYIALSQAVQERSDRRDLDGTRLMQTVFSQKDPILVVGDEDEQLGFMWLFSGAVMGIRNPKAHRLIQQPDSQRTLEWLGLASVLLRVLDDAGKSSENHAS